MPDSQAPGAETLIWVWNRGQGSAFFLMQWPVGDALRNAGLNYQLQANEAGSDALL